MADNYDPDATRDDGSCEYGKTYGCTDTTAENYNPQANEENGSCEYLGCMDTNADNYNP